ncbi:MAG: hypothetical protein WAX66_01495 [Patescibacteria group bacterium]|jgi:hypothetical protein
MERIIPCVVKFTGIPRFYVVQSSRGKVISILVFNEGEPTFKSISESISLPDDRVILLNCIKGLKNDKTVLVCEFDTPEDAEKIAVKASKVDYDLVDFTRLQVPV